MSFSQVRVYFKSDLYNTLKALDPENVEIKFHGMLKLSGSGSVHIFVDDTHFFASYNFKTKLKSGFFFNEEEENDEVPYKVGKIEISIVHYYCNDLRYIRDGPDSDLGVLSRLTDIRSGTDECYNELHIPDLLAVFRVMKNYVPNFSETLFTLKGYNMFNLSDLEAGWFDTPNDSQILRIKGESQLPRLIMKNLEDVGVSNMETGYCAGWISFEKGDETLSIVYSAHVSGRDEGGVNIDLFKIESASMKYHMLPQYSLPPLYETIKEVLESATGDLINAGFFDVLYLIREMNLEKIQGVLNKNPYLAFDGTNATPAVSVIVIHNGTSYIVKPESKYIKTCDSEPALEVQSVLGQLDEEEISQIRPIDLFQKTRTVALSGFGPIQPGQNYAPRPNPLYESPLTLHLFGQYVTVSEILGMSHVREQVEHMYEINHQVHLVSETEYVNRSIEFRNEIQLVYRSLKYDDIAYLGRLLASIVEGSYELINEMARRFPRCLARILRREAKIKLKSQPFRLPNVGIQQSISSSSSTSLSRPGLLSQLTSSNLSTNLPQPRLPPRPIPPPGLLPMQPSQGSQTSPSRNMFYIPAQPAQPAHRRVPTNDGSILIRHPFRPYEIDDLNLRLVRYNRTISGLKAQEGYSLYHDPELGFVFIVYDEDSLDPTVICVARYDIDVKNNPISPEQRQLLRLRFNDKTLVVTLGATVNELYLDL